MMTDIMICYRNIIGKEYMHLIISIERSTNVYARCIWCTSSAHQFNAI